MYHGRGLIRSLPSHAYAVGRQARLPEIDPDNPAVLAWCTANNHAFSRETVREPIPKIPHVFHEFVHALSGLSVENGFSAYVAHLRRNPRYNYDQGRNRRLGAN